MSEKGDGIAEVHGLKMFDHLPRKLRLKNNRNVNVFCDAAFWEQGFVRLLYQRAR